MGLNALVKSTKANDIQGCILLMLGNGLDSLSPQIGGPTTAQTAPSIVAGCQRHHSGKSHPDTGGVWPLVFDITRVFNITLVFNITNLLLGHSFEVSNRH